MITFLFVVWIVIAITDMKLIFDCNILKNVVMIIDSEISCNKVVVMVGATGINFFSDHFC